MKYLVGRRPSGSGEPGRLFSFLPLWSGFLHPEVAEFKSVYLVNVLKDRNRISFATSKMLGSEVTEKMKQTMKKFALTVAAAAMMAIPAFPAAGNAPANVSDRVRHELVMLPYFGIFDNLQYRVDGSVVTLYGQVTRPVLKSDAAGVVKHIEGVTRVDNQIEVLPLSPMDDRIRIMTARAIYGYPALQRYGLGTQPPIRIIVKNGNVTLEGIVANQGDKNITNIRANGVPGVFSVKNDLRVEKRG